MYIGLWFTVQIDLSLCTKVANIVIAHGLRVKTKH